jgi:hypothetical protein
MILGILSVVIKSQLVKMPADHRQSSESSTNNNKLSFWMGQLRKEEFYASQ